MDTTVRFPVDGVAVEAALERCYDGPVPAAGTARAHRDPAWCAWRIRAGGVELRWKGRVLRGMPGDLVLVPGGLRRDQVFAPGSRIASLRVLLRRDDGLPPLDSAAPLVTRPPARWNVLVAAVIAAEPGPAHAAAFAAAWAAWWDHALAAGWRSPGAGPRDPRLTAILAVLHAHGRIGPAPWEALTTATGLSRRQIDRLCRDGLGLPASAWLDTRMAERAAALLADPTRPVKAVAARCGFSDPSHFVRWFRRQRGTTPGRARGGA
ncbi:MAG: HTH-type transcriptional regulator CdhR [Planctomycetota bacterium]|jgi:AraC-like DNA-binding protein